MTNANQRSGPKREILIVSHYFDAHGGGIERAVRRLINEIAESRLFNLTWAASEEGTASTAKTSETKSPADYTPLPMKSYNFLERLCGVPWPIWSWGSLRQLRAAVKRADLVWLHDAPYMGNILAFRAAQKAKKPVVITQHIGQVPYRNSLLRSLANLADRLFTRPMLAKAQQTVFISDRVAEAYHRQIPFKKPIMIVPNGVDPDIFHPISAEQRWKIRSRFALRDDQPVLLFAGRFTEKKGLPVLEKLVSLLPEWRFWLVGQGSIDPERWFQPNVHVFHGRSGAALAELYQAADLLILPSFGEGFPLVIQEAMACGLPAICSPETAAGSQLAKAFLLTAAVDPASPAHTAKAWAKRIKAQREFLPLPQANTDLANAAHYFWSWPKIAACYESVFENLCGKR